MATYKQLALFPEYNITGQGIKALSEHRRRIKRFRNLDLIEDLAHENGYSPIVLKAVKGIIPHKLIAFSKASRSMLNNKIVHFYEYDYVIDAIWNNPQKYTKMLKRAYAVIGPDWSMNPSYPEEVNKWNFFMIRVISHYLQKNGVSLIPNIPVCSPLHYDSIFSSFEVGGIYAISNVQAYNNYFSRHQWYNFVREAIKRLTPEALIIYGNRMEIAGVKAYYFENENLNILRNGKRK